MEETIAIQFLNQYLAGITDITNVVETRIFAQHPDTSKTFPKLTYVSFGGVKRGGANCFFGENLYFGIFVDVPKSDILKPSFKTFMTDLTDAFDSITTTYDSYTVRLKRMNTISPATKFIDEMDTHVTRFGFQIEVKFS